MKMHAPKNQSSHIHSVGHDAETDTLAIRFHQGGTYHYRGVDEDMFRELHGHESPGSFFHSIIKNKFRARKI